MKQILGYVIGFVSSIVLTLTAYFLVTSAQLTGLTMMIVLGALAIVQLFVQLFCFLHLGQEEYPRWRLAAFIAMAIVLLIVVVGSIWIMNNLNYHMMSPDEMNAQMMQERDKGY